MKYLLDTNIASDLFNKSSTNYTKLIKKVQSLSNQDSLHVSILTLYELEYGLENAPEIFQAELRVKIHKIKSLTDVFALKEEGIEHFGKLKADYRKKASLKKEDMGDYNVDIMLASSAIVEGAILISADSIHLTLAKIYTEFQSENWIA